MLLRFTVILWCVLPFQGWYSVAHITYRKVCVTFLLSRPATGKELQGAAAWGISKSDKLLHVTKHAVVMPQDILLLLHQCHCQWVVILDPAVS